MAEEDLIFGKNRHFFGGIEPSNMRTFNANSAYDGTTDRVRITVSLPLDTTIDNQTLCSIAGAVIRRKSGSYPEDEFDGDLVQNVTENGPIYDTNVVFGNTYYYAAFPYTKQGVYNRNKANRAVVTVVRYAYIFGFDLTMSEDDPEDRVVYPSGVDNTSYTPAAMAFGSVFNYGDWPSNAGELFMPKPCMLNYDGSVAYYLSPSDYTKKADGVTASDVANTSFGGNAMMEWPKIFTKRWTSDGIYHFRCSDIAMDEDWDCWCNYDINDHEIDHFYTPIFFGSLIGGKLRSISGQSNSVSKTAANEISYALANNPTGKNIWYTENLADRLLIQDLLTMMAKSTNTQSKYGSGRSDSSNTAAIGQGTMNTKGLFWGSNDQTSGVKVFGMENWWGNLWRRTAGWINVNGTQKIKITRGTHDGSVATDYNLDGANYLTIAGATPAGTSGGYINTTKGLNYGRLPITASGSATTFECDGWWFNNAQSNYAVVGGSWDYALLVGGFSVALNRAPSFASADLGAALSCKPLAA